MLNSLETGKYADIYTSGHMVLRMCLVMGASISTAYTVAGLWIEGLIRERLMEKENE